MSSNSLIVNFIHTQREKALAYLSSNFALRKEDCEDVFQDAVITLHNNICNGKLDQLTASVTTYFISICRNKAYELLRHKNRYVTTEQFNEFSRDKANTLIAMDGDDYQACEEKERLVREIVNDLPSPCNELLWGFYRDGLPMKSLAQKFGYASENAVKVTKHRCCEKFQTRYTNQLNKLR